MGAHLSQVDRVYFVAEPEGPIILKTQAN